MTNLEIETRVEQLAPRGNLVSARLCKDLLRKAFKEGYGKSMEVIRGFNQIDSRIKQLKEEFEHLSKARREAEMSFNIAKAIFDGIITRMRSIEDKIINLEQGQLDFQDIEPSDRSLDQI